jgi:tripartite-type tricarboxylate transporter receptor subunit TctC
MSILGMFAPARTPAPIIDRINQDAIRFLQMPDTRERLLSAGPFSAACYIPR